MNHEELKNIEGDIIRKTLGKYSTQKFIANHSIVYCIYLNIANLTLYSKQCNQLTVNSFSWEKVYGKSFRWLFQTSNKQATSKLVRRFHLNVIEIYRFHLYNVILCLKHFPNDYKVKTISTK